MEPTPGAEPCMERLFPYNNLKELHERLIKTEHNYVEFLIYKDEKLVVTLLAFIDMSCFKVLGLRIRGCYDRQNDVLKLIAEPESSDGDIEPRCAEARVPANPPYRVLRTLEKLGLKEVEPIAYRIVDIEEVPEIWPSEESGFE